ncbi:unnamed protein product [Brassica rapa]|uniref:Uncharacterized protein n=2 Tax=Brassica TaxID=3705 RepID=A0A3P5ZBN0_BRACM|nr:unnamed protein product [Brassica napus]CAG7888716.1 unnamed protein product [Brassica rapa]CDY29737.1 BnaAnng03590D [Brassica napus]VDC76089.1 unnamed protein product [Brassica rapa]
MREFIAFGILERKGEITYNYMIGQIVSSVSSIQKADARGGIKKAEKGIPATFTGGKKYIKQHCYDAMSLCKFFKVNLHNSIGELTKKNGSFFGSTPITIKYFVWNLGSTPLAHILLFIEKESKFLTADDIDNNI